MAMFTQEVNYAYSGAQNYCICSFRLGKRSRYHARRQPSHACELEDSGIGPAFVRIGAVHSRTLYRLDDLNTWLDNNRVETSDSKAVAS